MKWGLLGGTFDPVHFGHLRCAQEILEILGLDKICFIPSSRPPLKTRPELTPFTDRLVMAGMAVADHPSFTVTDIENMREGPSYTIDTVRELLKIPRMEPYFILGQDAFTDIRKWKDWEDFLQLSNFVIMTRPGYDNRGLEPALSSRIASEFVYHRQGDAYIGSGGKSLFFRAVTFLDISSTDIRNRVRTARSIRYLVPESVRSYIELKGLYRY
jgi:nicotinate-nucleotide adenylyltransferase